MYPVKAYKNTKIPCEKAMNYEYSGVAEWFGTVVEDGRLWLLAPIISEMDFKKSKRVFFANSSLSFLFLSFLIGKPCKVFVYAQSVHWLGNPFDPFCL